MLRYIFNTVGVGKIVIDTSFEDGEENDGTCYLFCTQLMNDVIDVVCDGNRD